MLNSTINLKQEEKVKLNSKNNNKDLTKSNTNMLFLLNLYFYRY